MSVTDHVIVDEPLPPEAPHPPRAGRIRTGLIGALAGVLVGGGMVGGLVLARTSHTRSPQPAATAVTTPLPTPQGGGIDVRAVLSRVEPAVVSISSDVNVGRFGRGTAAGTGMIITNDGDVLTNAHVVEGAQSMQVSIPNNGTHTAHLLGMDQDADMAVIKIDGVKDLPTVSLGSSKSLQVGDPVVAVGNALALDGSPTVTTGIVSALDRSIDAEGGSMSHLIQTDAAINPGNSGGPLLNSQAQVVGMNTAVAGNAQNIGFAIAMDQITPKLDGLKKGSSPSSASSANGGGAFLGVSLDDSQQGAVVTQIVSGSPADKAGLRNGDVIGQIDNTQVGSAADLVTAIRTHKPGDKVRLVVQRNFSQQAVTVTLGNAPAS